MMLVRRVGREGADEVTRLRPTGIIAYVADRWLIRAAEGLRVPLVDTAVGEFDVPMVISLDNDGVGRLAADHLSKLGLENFGYCGVRGKVASVEREERFAAHLGDRARHFSGFSQVVAEGESRMVALVRWLRGLPKPVGVLAFDDKLGERVLAACQVAGLTVPRDVAVLGIGDDELMCEVSWPTLSSIRLPTHRLGFEAGKLLDQLLRNTKIQRCRRTLEPSIVVARESTDTLAVPDELVREVVQHLREEAGNRRTSVGRVARVFDVSRRTLDRRFVHSLGRTVNDVLAEIRMQIARQQLGETLAPVRQIATSCGFGTPAAFSRAFHQHTGVWPSDYRQKVQIEHDPRI